MGWTKELFKAEEPIPVFGDGSGGGQCSFSLLLMVGVGVKLPLARVPGK